MPSTRSHKRKPKPVVSYTTAKSISRAGRIWWLVIGAEGRGSPVAYTKSEAWAGRIAQALTDEEEFV